MNEDIKYANRLIEAGVPAGLHVIPGLYHGFDSASPRAGKTADFHEAARRALSAVFSK